MIRIREVFAEKGIFRGDIWVWVIFIGLCLISLVEVYSATSSMSYSDGAYWKPTLEHWSFILVGVIVVWIVHLFPINFFKVLSVVGLHFVVFPLLCIVLALGKVNNAARWIKLGGVTFQPSEFAKIALVVFVAYVLSHFRTENGVHKNALKVVLIESAVIIGLIGAENFSTAGIIGFVIFCMLFYAKVSKKFLITVTALGLIGVSTLVTGVKVIPKETFVQMSELPLMHRLPTWVSRMQPDSIPQNPRDYDIDKNRQVAHAKIAIATNGIIGKAPGNSVQRDHLPLAFSDFIFAIILEEFGIEGGFLVMALYLGLMWRAREISKGISSLFASYMIMGLALMMTTQAMINMAVAVGAFPVTGQPLPLISKGGTSFMVYCVYIGIILSVSYKAKKKIPETV